MISSESYMQLTKDANLVFSQLIKWFTANKLTLNCSKTNCIDFSLKKIKEEVKIQWNKNKIDTANHTKFLGLDLDENVTWEHHINTICQKLSAACFALRTLSQKISQESLKQVYYSYFHSIMSYGIMFWALSTKSKKIFLLQKRAIRILCKKRKVDSCRQLFKDLKILPLSSQYIYDILSFITDNYQLKHNRELHSHETRNKNNLHMPSVSLTLTQKGAHCSMIKIYNVLPTELKTMCSKNPHLFKRKIRTFLNTHAFYTIQEYFSFLK